MSSGLHDKYFSTNKDSLRLWKRVTSKLCTCEQDIKHVGFAIDGYPCDCHLQEDGVIRSRLWDCGTAYAAWYAIPQMVIHAECKCISKFSYNDE